MKRNMFLAKGFLITVAAASMLSFNAVAAQTQEDAQNETEISSNTQEEAVAEDAHQLKEGKITSIEPQEDGYTRVTIEDDSIGMICNIKDTVFVVDQKTGELKQVSDLEEGMDIALLLKNNAPMTMSIPPMTSGIDGVVIKSEDIGFMDLSTFDENLVNKENTLQLNIGEETKIYSTTGAKKIFGAEDMVGKECLVFYTVSTRSIPAHSTPSFVMIMEEEAVEETQTPAETEENTPQTAQESDKETVIPVKDNTKYWIREIAEQNGYHLLWTGNEEPVVLEKDDVKIEIQVDSKNCSINGVNTELENAPVLEEGKMVVGAEVKDILANYNQ